MTDLVLIPVLVYAGLALYAYFFADRQMFLPQTCSYTEDDEQIWLHSADGVRLAAYYRRHPRARFTILYSHGNAEDLGDIQPLLAELYDIGFSILAYDYRGYGLSDGKPTTAGVCFDIEAAYSYARGELGIPAENLLLYGRSIGGGPACYLAARKEVAGLILQSTFTSAFVVVTRIPILPFDRFRNLEQLRHITCPVLVMHGTKDRVIPFRHGQQLYKQAGNPKRHLWVEDVGHNRFPGTGREDYAAAISEFAELVRKQHPETKDIK